MCARKSERRASVSEYMCVSMHLLANVKISIPTVCFFKNLIYISGFISVGCSWPLYIAVYVCVCGWNEHECREGLRWYPCGFPAVFSSFSCVFSVWIFLLSNTHGEVAAWPVLCLSLSLSLNNALCTINHHSSITASHIGRSTRFKQVGFVTTEHR